MIHAAAILLALATQAAPPKHWKDYDRGVRWEPSVETAFRRAAELRRPVLLYQLVGDMNLEGC
jgi:hypothetical protein